MLGLGIIGWIVIGGLAGWIASKIKGTDAQQGLLLNIVVGVVGGLIGGLVLQLPDLPPGRGHPAVDRPVLHQEEVAPSAELHSASGQKPVGHQPGGFFVARGRCGLRDARVVRPARPPPPPHGRAGAAARDVVNLTGVDRPHQMK